MNEVIVLALFSISDLHLSFGSDKPMDIFGGWNNYTERIKANWERVVSNEDTVVLPGDLSWALKLCDTLSDFKFLQALPGKKIIIKGNHDLWWCTLTKMKQFFAQNGIDSVEILQNNFYPVDKYAVCGTRGWILPSAEDNKILQRELGRLRASLESARNSGLKPIVFLHYPPAWEQYKCDEFFDIFKEYSVDTVYHGHIHGVAHNTINEIDGVKLKLLSCDCIDFCPYRIV